MSKFEVGDKVQMTGVPIVVEVLELGSCGDSGCSEATFRFKDPETGNDDWMHCDEFERVSA